MAVYLNITDEENGGKEIKLAGGVIKEATLKIDTDDDSEIKSGKISILLTIKGTIGDDSLEVTKDIANWAKTPSEKSGIYRKVELLSVAKSKVERKAVLPYAFIIDYEETYIEEKGSFFMLIKQKVDRSRLVEIDGNYKYYGEDEE